MVWLAYPALYTELSRPRLGCPSPAALLIQSRHFGYKALSDFCPLDCYNWFSFFPSPFSSPFPIWSSLVWSYPLWTLPDIPASGYALPRIYNKLSPPLHLGTVMSFPFLFFFFCFPSLLFLFFHSMSLLILSFICLMKLSHRKNWHCVKVYYKRTKKIKFVVSLWTYDLKFILILKNLQF